MSVTITITDPSSLEPNELQATVNYLSSFLMRRKSDVTIGEAFDEVRAAAALGACEGIATLYVDGERAGTVTDMIFTPAASEVEAGPNEQAALAFGGSPLDNAPRMAAEIDRTVFGTPTPATTVDLDKDGLPWDGRLHASTKTQTVDGAWKKKRGVEQAEVDRVTAELRMTMMAPAVVSPPPPVVTEAAVPPPPPAPPVVAETIVPPPPPVVAETIVPPPPPVVAETIVPPPLPPAPAATNISFAEFMGHVTAGVTSMRFTREAVAAACAAHGIPNLPGLINRPDLIPAVARELGLMA